jgi:hypothetical protein
LVLPAASASANAHIWMHDANFVQRRLREEVSMASPENKEAPNKSETRPSKDRTETQKQLGRVAINGSQKDKR